MKEQKQFPKTEAALKEIAKHLKVIEEAQKFADVLREAKNDHYTEPQQKTEAAIITAAAIINYTVSATFDLNDD